MFNNVTASATVFIPLNHWIQLGNEAVLLSGAKCAQIQADVLLLGLQLVFVWRPDNVGERGL